MGAHVPLRGVITTTPKEGEKGERQSTSEDMYGKRAKMTQGANIEMVDS